MKAVIKVAPGPGHVELGDVPEPECGPNRVIVEVAFCGLCGTDLHVLHDTFRNYPPVILGHEFSGRIVDVGDGVARDRIGRLVTVCPASAVICGACDFCRTGRFMFCPQRRGMGHGVNGALARYVAVREDQTYRVPDWMPPEEAAVSEPLAAVLQAVAEFGEVRPGDTALVSGPGPIGLLTLQLLAAQGVKTIVAGPSEDGVRLALARTLGAALAVDIGRQDLQEIVMEETHGQGVDLAFECAGAPASARACFSALRREGRYAQLGIFGRPITVDMDVVLYKQLRVSGSVGYTVATWAQLMKLYARGQVRPGRIVTDVLPLQRWQEAFDLCTSRQAGKVLLAPAA